MHPTIHAFTIEEYQQFLEIQPSHTSQRYELIKGVIYEMPPIGSEHAYTVDILNRLLSRMVDDSFLIRVQNPIQLADSQPQPDLTVLQQNDQLRFELPTPQQCKLVIEVADSSVTYDREVKAHLYAEAGIPEYWLVNLPERVIQQYQEPTPAGYNLQRIWRRGETLKTAHFPGVAIPVTTIVGAE